MSQHARRARDALVALLVALAPFAYKQAVAGDHVVAGVTAIVMLGLVVVYRYADARTLEEVAATAPEDADELKPVLRRIGQALRSASRRDQNGT